MRVDKEAFPLPERPEESGAFRLIGLITGKYGTDLLHDRGVRRKDALFLKVRHGRPDKAVVRAGGVEKKPFEIAGDKDVHRRGHRKAQRASRVVDPRLQEIRQHAVLVGGAKKL